jgi:hypothetical protein
LHYDKKDFKSSAANTTTSNVSIKKYPDLNQLHLSFALRINFLFLQLEKIGAFEAQLPLLHSPTLRKYVT